MPISHRLRLGPFELLLFSNNILAYKTSMCGNSEAPTDFLIRPLSPQKKKIIIDLGPRNQGPTKKERLLPSIQRPETVLNPVPIRPQPQIKKCSYNPS